jgi:hypothetical protein
MLIVTMFMLIFFFFFGGLYGYGPRVSASPQIIVAFAAAIGALSFGLSFSRVVPVKDDVEITTESRCPSCGFLLQRGFVNGDFISKQDKPCPKDGAVTTIQKIFVSEPPAKS